MTVDSAKNLIALAKLLAVRVVSNSDLNSEYNIPEALAEIRARGKQFLEGKPIYSRSRFQCFVTQETQRIAYLYPPSPEREVESPAVKLTTRTGKAVSTARAKFNPADGGRHYDKPGKSGRPSNAWNLGRLNAKDACLVEATALWGEMQSKSEKERSEAASKVMDTHDITLSYNTIRSRVQAETKGTKRGPKPMLENAELVLVEYILEMGELGWTFTKEEVMIVMDRLVVGTPQAEAFQHMKQNWTSSNTEGLVTGDKWYELFMKRNKHKLREGTIDYRHALRKEWTTVEVINWC